MKQIIISVIIALTFTVFAEIKIQYLDYIEIPELPKLEREEYDFGPESFAIIHQEGELDDSIFVSEMVNVSEEMY